nr:ribonuclease H-like domain-containing protein [Tanacetum cinerariifolium]
MFDSGCPRHMTWNKALLTYYQDIDGGFVAFGGSTKCGKITGIGKIRTNKIYFEDVFFVKELKFNLFFVSQMRDKKNSVRFTEFECLVLFPDFKLIDESQDDPHKALKDKRIVDSGCSKNMTGNKAHLADYQEFKGDSVAFGGSNGKITGKEKIKTGKLDFEDVYYVKELKHYNLFSVSQMCDKKNKTSRGKNQKTNVSINDNQKKQNSKVKKPKKVGFIERLATPKPSKPKYFLRWSPTGRLFDLKGKIIASSESESQSDCSKGDNACTSNPLEPTIKRFPNSTFSLVGNPTMFMVIQICLWCVDSGCSKHMTENLKLLINFVWKFLGTVRFKNNHVAAILGFSDLQWGNILITRVYFIEGLGHNLFLVGQFCDSDLERLHLLHMDLCGPMRIASINGKRALCYPKNNREDIGKLGAKGDIGFFIGYSADSCAYRVFNRRTKKIMETMNVSFNELLVMAFEQRSSKLGLHSMTSGQISSGLDLTYALSTITSQQPTEGELDLLFEAMYDDYIGGQPSSAARTVLDAQAHPVRQTLTTSTSIADIAPSPTNSSSQATNFPNTSQDVDELNSQQQHV